MMSVEIEQFNAKLTEIKEVLAWASENVKSVVRERESWVVFSGGYAFDDTTLYKALFKAWSNLNNK